MKRLPIIMTRNMYTYDLVHLVDCLKNSVKLATSEKQKEKKKISKDKSEPFLAA